MPYDDYYDDEEWEERSSRFADPGGDSALHVADRGNPRNLKCPTCGWPNRLTERDVASGYQCDSCANAQERGMDISYYDGPEGAEDEECARCNGLGWRAPDGPEGCSKCGGTGTANGEEPPSV